MNLKKTVMILTAATVFMMLLFFCNQMKKEPLLSTKGQSYEKAVVREITKDNLQEDGNRYGNQTVKLKMKSGTLKGQTVSATSPGGTLFGADCVKGMRVIAIVSVSDGQKVVTVYSQDRTIPIIGFVAFFVLTVCFVGGIKGLKAIISLAFTGVCIVYLMFPLIYRGCSPILVTIGICCLVTIFTLTVIGGCTKKTVAAVTGTTFGVAAAGIAALAFGHFAGISGMNVSEIETLSYVSQYTKIRIGELLFAGIILSSLGAVMDVGMSMASTMQELHETDPNMGKKQLYLSGIRVGRDMMGTMTNTLILAYVGGSITTLIINYAYDLSGNQLLNSYNIGIEIMQGIAGSLGVVLTVPFTALIVIALLDYKPSFLKRKNKNPFFLVKK